MTQLTPFSSDPETASSDSPEQKRLTELWKKIEKRQTRNQNFAVKKDKLFTQFKETVLPAEQALGEQTYHLLEFLIAFLTRKSFSHNQRDELLYWIDEELAYIRNHPFLNDVDHEALQKKVNEAMVMLTQSQNVDINAQDIELFRAEIELMFDQEMQLSDDEIVNLIKDPSLFSEFIERMDGNLDEEDPDLYEQNEQYNDPFQDFGGGQTEDEYFEQHSSQNSRQKDLGKLFKNGQLNKIYKKLANVLHPDKELNPAKKEQKHLLMQVLSEARKNKDAYTLLKLYQTHVNDGEFSFDAQTMTALQTFLAEKLHQLDDELHAAKYNNELSALVWQTFSKRSKKATDQGFKGHVSKLEAQCREHSKLIKENTSVAKMKKVLQQRMQYNRDWDNSQMMAFFDQNPPF